MKVDYVVYVGLGKMPVSLSECRETGTEWVAASESEARDIATIASTQSRWSRIARRETHPNGRVTRTGI